MAVLAEMHVQSSGKLLIKLKSNPRFWHALFWYESHNIVMEQMTILQVGHLPESVCFVGCGTKLLSSNHIRKPNSTIICECTIY